MVTLDDQILIYLGKKQTKQLILLGKMFYMQLKGALAPFFYVKCLKLFKELKKWKMIIK